MIYVRLLSVCHDIIVESRKNNNGDDAGRHACRHCELLVSYLPSFVRVVCVSRRMRGVLIH